MDIKNASYLQNRSLSVLSRRTPRLIRGINTKSGRPAPEATLDYQGQAEAIARKGAGTGRNQTTDEAQQRAVIEQLRSITGPLGTEPGKGSESRRNPNHTKSILPLAAELVQFQDYSSSKPS